VNEPYVESLRPDHCGGICVAHKLAGQSKKGSVGRGHVTGDHGRRIRGKHRES
jgi:hypothetical protein